MFKAISVILLISLLFYGISYEPNDQEQCSVYDQSCPLVTYLNTSLNLTEQCSIHDQSCPLVSYLNNTQSTQEISSKPKEESTHDIIRRLDKKLGWNLDDYEDDYVDWDDYYNDQLLWG